MIWSYEAASSCVQSKNSTTMKPLWDMKGKICKKSQPKREKGRKLDPKKNNLSFGTLPLVKLAPTNHDVIESTTDSSYYQIWTVFFLLSWTRQHTRPIAYPREQELNQKSLLKVVKTIQISCIFKALTNLVSSRKNKKK